MQLTGRGNYTRYSSSIGLGTTLVTQPDLANDPPIASQLLARFLKDKESAIRLAFANNDLKKALRLVNCGSNGLADFTNAVQIGERIISN
ncbi:MAG: putative chitinase [Blastocatellia bacterium]|nr:putative chitinase [Blastocatellia bacterium]